MTSMKPQSERHRRRQLPQAMVKKRGTGLNPVVHRRSIDFGHILAYEAAPKLILQSVTEDSAAPTLRYVTLRIMRLLQSVTEKTVQYALLNTLRMFYDAGDSVSGVLS